MHHASTGNLDRRGIGDIDTLTVAGISRALVLGQRLRYRLYRHPLVMFGLGPAYLFFLQHRLPVGLMRDGWRPWLSTMATNLAIGLVAALLIWLIGIKAFLLVHLPIMLFAGLGRRLAVLRAAPVRAHDLGERPATGTRTTRRCTAARTTICRASCAGSPPISASTTSITSAAAFPTTGCRACCAIIPSCATSAG